MAGQIGRALAVFCVDEVVVFNDGQNPGSQGRGRTNANGRAERHNKDHDENTYSGQTDPDRFLAHLLSYLECPPHIRKDLFGMHPDLRFAGLLPSLDIPSHLRKSEWCQYREGVTVARPKAAEGVNTDPSPTKGTPVQTGLRQSVYVEDEIPENSRVTVKFNDKEAPRGPQADSLSAEAVAPSAPREEAGYYWGYTVRTASSISTVITECPFDGGYDVTIGTSERGVPLLEVLTANSGSNNTTPIPPFNHLLLVLGGVAGLETAVKSDGELQKMGVTNPKDLFDFWVNVLPGQGSRTIRTEEALWLTLMGLRQVVTEKGVR